MFGTKDDLPEAGARITNAWLSSDWACLDPGFRFLGGTFFGRVPPKSLGAERHCYRREQELRLGASTLLLLSTFS